ncbi:MULTISPECIES: NAD(P)H nitroreductase [unclassified Nocardia]|uniref:NAD(P)H nitroreductase n=1 Tax=unclassified Nocardia TaxID=2637762 RepID=UPI002E1E5AB8
MDRGLPDDRTVKTALALAVRAPSIDNIQPWRWRIEDRSVRLDLDPSRAVSSTDSEARDLVLSCGAVLHHLRITFAALGWSAVVRRLPNPANPNHLATVGLVRHRPSPLDIALCAAISRRSTDRRPYTSWPVPPGYLGLVTERAAAQGAILRLATDHARDRLAIAMRAAAERHAGDPGDRFEPAERHADTAIEPDFAELLVIGTTADDRLSRLRAGEALSAVLLTATNIGLATCTLTEPLEIPSLRRSVRGGVLDDFAYPQAVVRIGWAPTSAASRPVTPRRLIEDMLDPFDPIEVRAC